MLSLTLVAVGSAVGGVARYLVVLLIDQIIRGWLPAGTLAVNVSGAFAIGLLAAALAEGRIGGPGWTLLAVGALGSYTTVSSYALQTLLLARAGSRGAALAYGGLSAGLCLTAAAIGLWLGGGLVPVDHRSGHGIPL